MTTNAQINSCLLLSGIIKREHSEIIDNKLQGQDVLKKKSTVSVLVDDTFDFISVSEKWKQSRRIDALLSSQCLFAQIDREGGNPYQFSVGA